MPLLSDRVRDRIPWVQLGVESGLVVLSVLFALALDAWYDHAQEQEKVRRALRSIHAELVEVRGPMARRAEYHAALVDTFTTDSLSFQTSLSLRYVDPPSDAWDTAKQTGAVAFMDYDVVAPISAVYSRGDELTFLIRKSFDLIFDGVRYRGRTPNQMTDFGGYLNDVHRVESIYVERLDRAVAAIESRMPALAGASPPGSADSISSSPNMQAGE